MTSHDIAPPPRRRRRAWPILLALAVVLAGIWIVALVGYWLLTRAMAPPTVEVSRGTIVELDLAGPITDGPPAVDLGPLFGPVGRSMWQLRRGLLAAASDPDVAGILLRPQGAMLGWANANEVVELIDGVREAGKPVYALMAGDMVNDLDYFLATAADRIWVNPEAGIVVNGLVAEAQFLRGTFEKLHIEPQVIMYKEYKSAGETYGNYQMSPYMREALVAVLETTDDRFIGRVAARRKTDPERLRSFLGRGMTSAQEMVELGLADELGYRDQVVSAFEELDTVRRFRSVTLVDYSRGLPDPRPRGDRIAVIFGEGPIIAQEAPAGFPLFGSAMMSGPVVARHIERATDDPNVRAIVFRVNSPGGSPVGSDLVRRAVRNARKAGKPVVVSMADVAGSGGYWVAMDADAIVAQPTTITGSIGVVFQKLNLDGFYEWVGANVERVTTAPRANILGFGPMSAEEREAIESWMDQVYRSFTTSVAEGRGLELDHVREVARGRIWSGQDALERRLVDRLGGFEVAIEIAHELAGLDPDRELPLVLFPRPKSFLQRLMDNDWTSARWTPMGLGAARAALGLGLGGDSAALVDWVARLAEPRVWARAPEVRIY